MQWRGEIGVWKGNEKVRSGKGIDNDAMIRGKGGASDLVVEWEDELLEQTLGGLVGNLR